LNLGRLLHPRSVAVVGATDRGDAYGAETLRNLAAFGFAGEVWGVNPGRTEALGVPCFPTLGDLPGVPDAVAVAIPAPAVPPVIEQAGAMGAGGAVVFGAGFGEAGSDELHAALVGAARRHDLPVCGPNCDGLISLHSRAALWGDALTAPEPGHVALVSQSGNLVVNALAARRGLRLHTAVSSGNEAVVSAAEWVGWLAGEDGVRSIALLLESPGDGAALCEALARCAERGIGVAVLKVGASAAGAAAAAAHTGAVAGDQRVFRALMREAGAAWADDVHDLLELAKALAARGRRPRGAGLAVLTCSGGDSGLAADEAARREVELPAFSGDTSAALRALLPVAATAANPLDQTAQQWGDRDAERALLRTVGADPAIGQTLVFFDQPPGLAGALGESWHAQAEGILEGAEASEVGVLVAATLPELLDDATAWRFCEAGVPAVAGLRTGVACAAALATPPGDPVRLREIARATKPHQAGNRPPGGSPPAAAEAAGAWLAADGPSGPAAAGWLAEHEAKARLRAAGLPVVPGRLAATADEAVAALAEYGRVALKRSEPGLLHKSRAGALALDLATEQEVRSAFARLGAPVLVERMAEPGAEILLAVRRDGVVPVLVAGLGGVHAELLDDVALVPLPVTSARAEAALRSLRGAPLLARGDLAAAAELAAALTVLDGYELIECNPVLVHRHGAVVVDAVAKETAA
jgi:acetate---CoA ligase (ADP-forming)